MPGKEALPPAETWRTIEVMDFDRHRKVADAADDLGPGRGEVPLRASDPRVIAAGAVAGVAIAAASLVVVSVLVRWALGMEAGVVSTILIVVAAATLSFLSGRLARPWFFRLVRPRPKSR